MISLIGTYECKADAKGRMMMPVGVKKQLFPVIQDGFVLKRSIFQSCIELYPMREWKLIMEKLNKLNKFKKKNNDFIRRFTAGLKVVELDSTGRLLIPKDLCAFSGISKNIVISTLGNILEIWDKDKYESVIDDADAEDLELLSEEVMGGLDELS